MRPQVILLGLLALRSIGDAAPRSPAPAASRGAATGAPDPAPRAATAVPPSAALDPRIEVGDDAELAADAVRDGPRIPVIGPPIAVVLAAAYATAGLDRDPGGGWIRRARLGGLVPWVTVRTSRDTSWQDAHSEIGHGTGLEVRATWRLDRLVFDNHELQVASIEAARRRERRRLATRVIRAYFAWRRAAGTLAGPDDDRVAARLAEDTAELDALTDGWFSEDLLRRRRTESSPPTPRAVSP